MPNVAAATALPLLTSEKQVTFFDTPTMPVGVITDHWYTVVMDGITHVK